MRPMRCFVGPHRFVYILCYAVCVMTQQNATFWVLCTPVGGYDPQIRTRPRSLCIAPTPQVSSSYVYSFWSYRVDKQTDRRRRRHPTFFATLRRWVITLTLLGNYVLTAPACSTVLSVHQPMAPIGQLSCWAISPVFCTHTHAHNISVLYRIDLEK